MKIALFIKVRNNGINYHLKYNSLRKLFSDYICTIFTFSILLSSCKTSLDLDVHILLFVLHYTTLSGRPEINLMIIKVSEI